MNEKKEIDVQPQGKRDRSIPDGKIQYRRIFRNDHPHRSRMTRQILFQYCLSLVVFVVVFILSVFLAWNFSNRFIWQPSDPLYQILHWIKEYILLVGGVIC